MAHYKMTKETLKMLEDTKVSSSTNGTTTSIYILYKVKTLNNDGKVKTTDGSFNINVDTNPTSNCQLASLRGFYSNLSLFKERQFYFLPTPTRPTKAQEKQLKLQALQRRNEKYNLKARRLAMLKGFYYINNNITSKRQFFIDIPRSYVPFYHFFSPWACKKRIPSREVNYISTNGSNMMYSLMEIDKRKLSRYA